LSADSGSFIFTGAAVTFPSAPTGAIPTTVLVPTEVLDARQSGVLQWTNDPPGWQLAEQIQLVPTTFNSLPAQANRGLIAYISDCNTTTFHAAAAGGGTNKVLVVFDGATWRVGG
jgi:hypothetical protein